VFIHLTIGIYKQLQ